MHNTITLQNNRGLSVSLSPFGATWLSCKIPSSNTDTNNTDNQREILLGCHTDDLPKQNTYLGASVGRYANRIANAQFNLNGTSYRLSANQDNKHTLHGGADNFSYRYWEVAEQSDTHVTFSLLSENGDQGFPAKLSVKITYRLEGNSVIIDYHADTNSDTICALTNHAYFNLDGDTDTKKHTDMREQRLFIPSDTYLPIDKEGIPCADVTDVTDTPFDFRQAKTISQDFAEVLKQAPTGGYDHSWYFGQRGTEKLMATLQSTDNHIELSVYSTQPALQVYTGNFLAGTPNRYGGVYENFAGIALETGCLPNSPNMPDFIDDCLVSTDSPYQHRSRYVFNWVTE
ncbi:MAG: galactose-1-epimerase [Gammaproteobacteria bacterium]|nr:galactose-1-epimerase [Gammaproteobacteria bacterium]